MFVCGGDGCGGVVMEAGGTNGDIAPNVDGDKGSTVGKTLS